MWEPVGVDIAFVITFAITFWPAFLVSTTRSYGGVGNLEKFRWTKFLKRAISIMHKSVSYRLGKISNRFQNKFFDINIIRSLKCKFRLSRHCLAGCHFCGFTKKVGNCHNAQSIVSVGAYFAQSRMWRYMWRHDVCHVWHSEKTKHQNKQEQKIKFVIAFK